MFPDIRGDGYISCCSQPLHCNCHRESLLGEGGVWRTDICGWGYIRVLRLAGCKGMEGIMQSVDTQLRVGVLLAGGLPVNGEGVEVEE